MDCGIILSFSSPHFLKKHILAENRKCDYFILAKIVFCHTIKNDSPKTNLAFLLNVENFFLKYFIASQQMIL